jgi:hypothetical protein
MFHNKGTAMVRLLRLALLLATGGAVAAMAGSGQGAPTVLQWKKSTAVQELRPYLRAEQFVAATLPTPLKLNQRFACNGAAAQRFGRLPARLQQTPPGVKIGYTTYDYQTNFSIQNRMAYAAEENIVQVVWMAATDAPGSGWPDRGSYYAAVDVSDPSAPQAVPTLRGWQRIESVRTGWPALIGLPDGAVGILSHGGGRLQFSKNGGVLDEGWQTSAVAPDGALWPRLAIDQNGTLHAIYSYSSGAKAGQVGYIRSTDGGATWSEEVLLSGPDAVGGAAPSGAGGDAYAISAAGNTVVVVYYSEDYAAGIPAGLVVRASTDGGQTWSAPQLLMLEQYSKVYVDALVPPDTVSFHTDTIPTLAVMSVLADPDGGWHLAATIIPTYLRGRGIQRGDAVDLFEAEAIQEGAYLSVGALYGYWAPGAAEPSGSLIAPPAGSSVEPGTPLPRHLRYGEGYTRWIVLGRDAQGQIYAVYVSVKPGDTVQVQEGDAAVTYSYGHLYLTAKASDTSWTTPVDLTPEGIDAAYPTVPAQGSAAGWAFIVYQAGTRPGTALNDPTLPPDDIYFYAHALPTSVAEPTPTAGATLTVYPNPVTLGGQAQLLAREAGQARLELYDALGTRLSTLYEGWIPAQALRTVPLPTGMAAGTYYLKLSFNGHVQVQPVVIVR